MLHRRFGPTGEDVAVIGQGTWKMGGDAEADRMAVDALRRGIDLGMTLVDTAEMYGSGHAETLVGRAIRGRRDEVFLVTKVLPHHADAEGVHNAAEGSLRRLGVEAVDLYLLHWPSARVPLEETLAALEALVEQGKARFVGVSNFDRDDLEEATGLLEHEPLACDQVLYHPRDRGIEWELLPWCHERRVAVMAYSPFGSGTLPVRGSDPGAEALHRVADRHGRSPHQVALRWVTRHDHVFAVPKAVHPDHVAENAEAWSFDLEREDLALLDEAFPPPEGPTPLGII